AWLGRLMSGPVPSPPMKGMMGWGGDVEAAIEAGLDAVAGGTVTMEYGGMRGPFKQKRLAGMQAGNARRRQEHRSLRRTRHTPLTAPRRRRQSRCTRSRGMVVLDGSGSNSNRRACAPTAGA